MRKIAIVGNDSFTLTVGVGAQVVDVIRGVHDQQGGQILILTRGAGEFEKFIAHVSLALGIRCFAYPGHGGGDNLDRDSELVDDADVILAFLDHDRLDEHSGAAMVVDKALAAKKPVRAFTEINGELVGAASE